MLIKSNCLFPVPKSRCSDVCLLPPCKHVEPGKIIECQKSIEKFHKRSTKPIISNKLINYFWKSCMFIFHRLMINCFSTRKTKHKIKPFWNTEHPGKILKPKIHPKIFYFQRKIFGKKEKILEFEIPIYNKNIWKVKNLSKSILEPRIFTRKSYTACNK